MISLFDKKCVGKGENDGYLHFHLCPQYLILNVGIVW